MKFIALPINDYRVYWQGNDIDGADALRVLRVVLKKAQEQ